MTAVPETTQTSLDGYRGLLADAFNEQVLAWTTDLDGRRVRWGVGHSAQSVPE